MVDAIDNSSEEDLTRVVRTNSRILTLDRANNKMLVTIKKLYCPETDPIVVPVPMPIDIDDLDLVNGGDTAAVTGSTAGAPNAVNKKAEVVEVEEDEGDGYNLC